MAQTDLEPEVRKARQLGAAVLCALFACAACSSGTSGGGGFVLAADAGKSGSGFDGFAFDVQPSAGTDASSDAPTDSTQTTVTDAATDAGADATSTDASPDSVQLACTQTCEIDDDCNAQANPCTASVCQGGCCQVTTTVGVLCDDGVACNGPDACKNGVCTPAVPEGCDDGLPCTFDTCDGQSCHHTVLADWCHIGATCVPAGGSIPGNPCKICDPKLDQDSWSSQSGCCQLDSDCPALGACDKPTCEPSQGKCVVVKVPGCCKSDTDCDDLNPCTNDSCDLGTGNCASTAVTCPSPSDCQTATCDPGDGQCKPNLLPGWCFIDGTCIDSNATNPSNACQICVPGVLPNAWYGNPGAFCNDGNACTFSDICTSSGACKGTAQPGCCQSDSDCAAQSVGCKIGTCNTAVGLCALSDKPGCCTSGVCCDVVNQAVEPVGSQCAATVIGADYQCVGNDVQKRDLMPGCNGVSATVCTTSTGTAAGGDWATVSSCPSGTLCTPQGSGIAPVCQVQGSCSAGCGVQGSYGCGCSSDCISAGTCCPDANTACGCTSGDCCDVGAGIVFASGTPCGTVNGVVQYQCAGSAIQQRFGQGKCVGATTCSTAASDVIWGGWQTTQTCGGSCVAAADGSSASCTAPSGSCLGACGTQSHTGPCMCDASCAASGTCCADYDAKGCAGITSCGSQGQTCLDSCGGASAYGTCYCDDLCNTYGDCCPDKFICGCSP